MNMINLDMYTIRQMRNYRLRIKFAGMSYSDGCCITVRTTLFDATEVYTYTEEDLEKYGASELIRQSVSKFIETYELNFMIAIYNNKEETTMRNEKDIMEELTSENNSLKKTVKMLKDAINKRDEELRNLIKKNESLAEDIDMYWHHLVETIDKNEKLKDDIQTRMNNEKLDAVRIADLEDTVQMLREIIRRKDAAIQHDADAFRKEIDRLKSDCDALKEESDTRLIINDGYISSYAVRGITKITELRYEKDFVMKCIIEAALCGNTCYTFILSISRDTIDTLIAYGYLVVKDSNGRTTVSWTEEM